MLVKDPPHTADVIIVLGGDETERVPQAIGLFQKGSAGAMICTGWRSAGTMKRRAVKAGVPADKIFLEPLARHTYQHPLLVKPILEEHGFKSAIVVSSPYHMRRTAMLFGSVFRKTGIKIYYFPVENSWFKADSWWKTPEGRKTVKSEYSKMLVNIWGAKVSDAVYSWVRGKEGATKQAVKPVVVPVSGMKGGAP